MFSYTAVVRALWYNYPHDFQTYDIDTQFMWGADVLVMPVVYKVRFFHETWSFKSRF